jgi:hypothetical protein
MTPLSRQQDDAVADNAPKDAIGGKSENKCSLNQAANCTLDKPPAN